MPGISVDRPGEDHLAIYKGSWRIVVPKPESWASDPRGIDQVGCVYTSEGFEFDYVGAIVGPDVAYRPMDGGWVGQPEQSHGRVLRRGIASAEFTRYVKSTYRVVLIRGLRGCCVYFMDAQTRDFFLSRTEQRRLSTRKATEQREEYET